MGPRGVRRPRRCPNCEYPYGDFEKWCERHTEEIAALRDGIVVEPGKEPVTEVVPAPQAPQTALVLPTGGALAAPSTAAPPVALPVAAYLEGAMRQAGTLKLTREQLAILTAPVKPEEIQFRWADAAHTRALAYASHPETRRRFLQAFGPLGFSLVPLEQPRIMDVDEEPVVIYHGALIVDGRYVCEAYGKCRYKESNRNMSWDDAVEGAKSDCWSRVGKDLGMFLELWDRRFTQPLEDAWKAGQSDSDLDTKKCPQCGRRVFPSKFRQGEWYCNAKKGGCGWQGFLEVATPPSGPVAPQPSESKPAAEEKAGTEPGYSTRPPAPKKQPPKEPVGETTLRELDLALITLRRYEKQNDDPETDKKPWISTRIERWLREHNDEKSYQAAIARAEQEMEARRKLGQKPGPAEDDDLPW